MEILDLVREFSTGTPAAGMIIALFGGIFIKILDHTLVKTKNKNEEAEKIREELREAVNALNSTVEHAKKEADEWRARYWAEVESHADTKSRLHQASPPDSI